MKKFGQFNVPLKPLIVDDFPLTVTVFDDKDNVVQEEVIQYSNYEHRKFLGKITYEACSSGYTVETRKATAEEAKKLKE